MNQYSLPARLYLASAYLAGMAALLSGMEGIQIDEPWLLLVLCVLGSIALIQKVEGPAAGFITRSVLSCMGSPLLPSV